HHHKSFIMFDEFHELDCAMLASYDIIKHEQIQKLFLSNYVPLEIDGLTNIHDLHQVYQNIKSSSIITMGLDLPGKRIMIDEVPTSPDDMKQTSGRANRSQ
ncbi:6082_t:CDS:2, partial [Racocetra persica]